MRGATRSQLVLLAAYAGRLLLGVAITAVLGRSLGPQDFGFFTLVSTIYLVVPTFLDLGSGMLAVREITREPSQERPLLEGLMGWRLVSGVALAVAVLAMALAEAEPGRRLVLLGAATSLLLMAPGALAPVFTLRQALEGPSLLTLLGQVLILVGALVLHRLGAAGSSFAWLPVLREALGASAILVLAARLLGYWPRPGLRGRGLRRLLAPAAVLGAAVAAHDLYFYVDVFLVRLLRGEAELGAYSAALRLLNPLLGLPFVLTVPLLPVFSAAALAGRQRLADLVGGAAALLGGLGALAAAAGLGLAADLLRALYAGRYLEGGHGAVGAFRWLCVALLATALAAPFVSALLASGSERALLAISALGLAVNVAGNLLFVPRYGFTAAAATTALTEAIVCVAASEALRRSGVRVGLAAALPAPLALAAGILALTSVLPGSALVRIGAGALATAAGALYLVSRPAAREFRRGLAGEARRPA